MLPQPRSGKPFMSDEIDAYHEAGHVVMAYHLGCRIDSVTISPDRDDGPARHGDTQIAWNLQAMGQREFSEKAILVALAGPVAEMLHRQESVPIDSEVEWAHDWQLATRAATALITSEAQRNTYLDKVTAQVVTYFDQELTWAALGALVDNLVAHETLDGEQVREILSSWL